MEDNHEPFKGSGGFFHVNMHRRSLTATQWRNDFLSCSSHGKQMLSRDSIIPCLTKKQNCSSTYLLSETREKGKTDHQPVY